MYDLDTCTMKQYHESSHMEKLVWANRRKHTFEQANKSFSTGFFMALPLTLVLMLVVFIIL